MTRATTILPSYNAGELSPRLHGRVDQNVYGIGCKTMLGWIPTIEGGAIAAPGTRYINTAAGQCRLIEFEYSPTQGYVIEASNRKLRFYTNDERIETAPGVPYQLGSPWSYADTLQLDYQQAADVLFMVGAGQKPKKLERHSAVTFALVDLDLKNGPIGDGNDDEAKTITASGTFSAGGSVTITASAAIFASTDVGSLFEIESADLSDIKSWEPGVKISVGDVRTWDGRVYVATATYDGGTLRLTGGNAPEHDRGAEWDGSGTPDANGNTYGVLWEFKYGFVGLVKITGFTSTTVVSAEVIRPLADNVATKPTWLWAFGAFSNTRGWPDHVAIWNQSLVLTKDSTVYTSVIGDYENFDRRDTSGNFQRDLAGQFSLPVPSKIQWLEPDRLLLIGTEKGEASAERLITNNQTAGPPAFEVRPQGRNGSSTIRPIPAMGRTLFVQRVGRRLLEFDFDALREGYKAPDLTRLAIHIGRKGFTELAWQQEPERLVWAAMDDGTLAALTYDPEQQVMGWCRRELGAGMLVESICRITDPEGKRDQIWIAANLDGTRLVLLMSKVWELGDDQQDAVLVDAGLSYDGAPATLFSGLDHLNGKTVDILADGKPHPQRVVSGGAVTLDYAASKVHIGLPFAAVLTTLPIEAGQSEGTAQGKLKRIIGLLLRLLEAQGLRVYVQTDPDPIAIETRVPDDPMDEAVPLFTGDYPLTGIGTYERLGQITIERFQPTPATLLAIMPILEVGE